MAIEFELPKPLMQARMVLTTVAEEMMRSHSRECDENEGSIPWDYIEFMHTAMKSLGGGSLAPWIRSQERKEAMTRKEPRPPIAYQLLATQIEMLAWGDVGMYLVTPGGGLGAAAVQAAGNAEQKAKFLGRFAGEKPTFASMSMTEPGRAPIHPPFLRARYWILKRTNGCSMARRYSSPPGINPLPGTRSLVVDLSSSGPPLTQRRGVPGCVPSWLRAARRSAGRKA